MLPHVCVGPPLVGRVRRVLGLRSGRAGLRPGRVLYCTLFVCTFCTHFIVVVLYICAMRVRMQQKHCIHYTPNPNLRLNVSNR